MSFKADVSRTKLIYVIFEFVLLRITIIYYADAEQSALEIRTEFFFLFFFMVVANCNASCYWLHVHCASRLLHETQTLNLSRNVSKFYARQVVSDDREAKPKFAA